MSILHSNSRPWVAFDPANRQHRKWFSEFQKSGTWGHCPVRFFIPEDVGNLITMIQRRLVQYYVNHEFVVKKPQKTRRKTG